ncbi:unnamed protein product [Blepharisma stoltei]|uniref:Uncharacterized protein n=1 Tax=Blepharisma stoltei TaxID=1481888 RepID=A0AAU9KCC3_9CILI|nr:unnamed protein product [Blepharisma stoltei]
MDKDRLLKVLQNKENQLNEMQAQFISHNKTIETLQKRIRNVEGENELLRRKIEQKDKELEKELKEKDIIFARIQELEKTDQEIEINTPNLLIEDIKPIENEEIINVSSSKTENANSSEKQEEEPEKQIEPETFISNEIDITKELEKMGLGDLVKKY